MFDNLRRQMSEASDTADDAAVSGGRGGALLGLKPQQLFILSLMLFLNVAVLGCFALIAFEKIRLPF
jgi:hypothetical protein